MIGGVLVAVNTAWALRSATVEAMTQQTVSSFAEWLFLILFGIVILCSFVSAAQRTVSFKHTLKLLVKKRTLSALGVVILAFVALELLVRGASALHPVAGQLIGLVLVFPVFYAVRLFLTEACDVRQ